LLFVLVDPAISRAAGPKIAGDFRWLARFGSLDVIAAERRRDDAVGCVCHVVRYSMVAQTLHADVVATDLIIHHIPQSVMLSARWTGQELGFGL
jgi:hypothetical protein